MVAVDALIPPTTPVDEPTVAIPLLLLLQVPPASVSDMVELIQTEEGPVIEAGKGLTVTVTLPTQPVPLLTLITEVPPPAPVTIPVSEPTVATDVVALLQVPPPGVPVSVVVEAPWQKVNGPPVTVGVTHNCVICTLYNPISSFPKSEVDKNRTMAVVDVAVVVGERVDQDDDTAGGASMVVNVTPPSDDTMHLILSLPDGFM